MTTQALLGEYFEEQARWRDRKADEYPDDDRNAQSAAALRDLAAYARALPDDDRTIRRITRALRPAGELVPGEESAQFASRFGFGYTPASLGGELARFADLLEVEARQTDHDALSEKVREQRARRAAKRQGLMLQKSRRRDIAAADFGMYWLFDASTTGLVCGGQFGDDLDGIENYLG